MADSGEVTIEVEAAYRHYVDVFNRRNPIEIADLYDRPHAQVIGEVGLSIVNDDTDQQAWFEFVMAYLDDQGWDHTEMTTCRSGCSPRPSHRSSPRSPATRETARC